MADVSRPPARPWLRPVCWWLGHAPDYRFDPDGCPCKRCGVSYISYDEQVSPSRWQRVKDWAFHRAWRLVGYRRLRRLVPMPCPDCGKRYGGPCDCIPF